jgi:hypothetical protein
MEVSPAAGPLTDNAEPLSRPATTPPSAPAIKPEASGAPDANAIPKQSGSATKNTTSEEGRSLLQMGLNSFIMIKSPEIFTYRCKILSNPSATSN